MAYRQTYYNLYNPVEYSSLRIWKRPAKRGSRLLSLIPDYIFRDMNLKYSGSGTKSNYYVSLYGGKG